MADFFLEPDDAKTFGDIDYMRKAKRVKRTFAKTVSQPNQPELDIQVSALNSEKGKATGFSASSFSASQTSSSYEESTNGFAAKPDEASTNGFVAKPDEAATRRQSDSSMDMFRNMAKQIRK
jgi:hypothetical protein